MQFLRTIAITFLFIILSIWLSACSSGSSGGIVATQETNTEFWSGSARLQQCDEDIDMVGMFPGIEFLDSRAFAQVKATFERTKNFDTNGVLTSEVLALKAIHYDGAVFFDLTDNDPTNDVYAPTALTVVNPPASGNLLHLEFGNVPTVTVGPPTTFNTYSNIPVVEGGGLVMSDDGANRPHAFLYIHDKWGCDLVIAGIQKAQLGETGDEALPAYSVADFSSTVWSGVSEEFLDESPSPDFIPIKLTWIQEPNWQLDFGTLADITGGSGSATLSPSLGQALFTVTGGSIVLEDPHGFFTGTLTSDVDDWVVRGFLTPDKAYFAGFAWREPWTGYWHDLSLVKQ